MKASEDVVEDHLLRLALSQVVSDLIERGVDSGGKGRGARFVSVDGAVDELVIDGLPAANPVGRTGGGGSDGIALVKDVIHGSVNGFGKAGGSEGDVGMGREGKTVHTPELADVEGTVGPLNDDGAVGVGEDREPGTGAAGGCKAATAA